MPNSRRTQMVLPSSLVLPFLYRGWMAAFGDLRRMQGPIVEVAILTHPNPAHAETCAFPVAMARRSV